MSDEMAMAARARMLNAEEQRDNLAAAVSEVMGTLNYYIGPGARTAVGQDSIRQYERISLALRRAEGQPCPCCEDTGIDKDRSLYGPVPCRLDGVAGHGIDVPEEARRYVEERNARSAAGPGSDPC